MPSSNSRGIVLLTTLSMTIRHPCRSNDLICPLLKLLQALQKIAPVGLPQKIMSRSA